MNNKIIKVLGETEWDKLIPFDVKSTKDFLKFMDDTLDLTGNPEVTVFYQKKEYMFQILSRGTKKKSITKICFTRQGNNTMNDYLSTIQEFDTWAELFENATMRDGTKFMDVCKAGKVFW